MDNFTRVWCRLPPDLKDRLEAYCERKGTSQGQAIRYGLEMLLDWEEKLKDWAAGDVRSLKEAFMKVRS